MKDTIKDFRDCKQLLENDLLSSIQQKIEIFENMYGPCVSGLRVSFVEVTTLSDEKPKFLATKVDLEITI